MNFLKSLWAFSRPHTIIGTIISVTSLYLIATVFLDGAIRFPIPYWLSLLACLGANVYIVGLNQLTDIDIDRINKPTLPLASGALSITQGKIIVAISLLISLVISVFIGNYLLVTVLISLFIGTIYSVPPIRLKRFHFWAAACIFTIRGVVVNIFLFLHFSNAPVFTVDIPDHVWILMSFMFLLSLVIAWFKDIPDQSGDSQFSISTLTLKIGPGRVFLIGNMVLILSYIMILGFIFTGMCGVNWWIMVIGHMTPLGLIFYRIRQTDPAQPASMSKYYLFVWSLFFLEYIVFTAACLVGVNIN